MDIGKNIAIPYMQYAETLFLEPEIAHLILFKVDRMLSTIKLDHELFFKADEIDDIHSNWLLPFEFQTQQSFRPEILPKELFRISRSFSQIFCQLDMHFTIPPSPFPSPTEGRGDP